MKKIILILTAFVGLYTQAQIVEPVKWSSKVVKVSETELDLVTTAVIEDEWHLYSQFTPEGGAQPLVFNYKNQKGNYQLVGKTKEGKYKKAFNDIFEIDEYFFSGTASFTQRIKILNPKLQSIPVSVQGQACIDGRCTQTEANLNFKLPEIKVTEEVAKTLEESTKVDSSASVKDSSSVNNEVKETDTTAKSTPVDSKAKEEKVFGPFLFYHFWEDLQQY